MPLCYNVIAYLRRHKNEKRKWMILSIIRGKYDMKKGRKNMSTEKYNWLVIIWIGEGKKRCVPHPMHAIDEEDAIRQAEERVNRLQRYHKAKLHYELFTGAEMEARRHLYDPSLW